MNVDMDIEKCIEVLKRGGVILYPTDTVWGLGCDATNAKAVERITAIKQRPDDKSMIVLVNHIDMLSRYVDIIPTAAVDILEYATKPTTIVFDKMMGVAENVVAQDGSCGVRLTTDEFCKKIIRKLNKPLVSTSANISGEKTARNFKQIDEAIKAQCDYVVQFRSGETTLGEPSCIIKLSNNGEVAILRK
jgi:L-threonylcarbamoyladenylate synthase